MVDFIPDPNKELSQDEIKILKEMVEREKAVARIWNWIRSFVLIAVPISALWTFWEHVKK